MSNTEVMKQSAVKLAGQHPKNISVHSSIRQPVSKRTNGCCRVITNSSQRKNLFSCTGENAAKIIHNLPGCCMKISSPAIIPQPLPILHHLILIRPGKCCHIGKPFRESVKILQSLYHPGLLKYDLRNPDQVRIRSFSPR